MKKIIAIVALLLCSACASGNMYHPGYGFDWRQYKEEEATCSLQSMTRRGCFDCDPWVGVKKCLDDLGWEWRERG
jgi:hypothetical protein